MIRKRNSKWYYIIPVKDAQRKTHRIERAGDDTRAECRFAEVKAHMSRGSQDGMLHMLHSAFRYAVVPCCFIQHKYIRI